MSPSPASAPGFASGSAGAVPIVSLRGAAVSFGARTLWAGLDLDVRPGEFIAVLGANGSGKTTLLRVLLGEQALSAGTVSVMGDPVRRGSEHIGYIPQRTAIEATGMVRARDVVRMGVDGHRWGLPVPGGARARSTRATVRSLLDEVGATSYANAPVSMLSGGELQRVRVAQALANDPELLLCDEPLSALDLRRQQEVTALMDRTRTQRGTAVLVVTHELNAILDYVDRVLYFAGGKYLVGTPDEVITSERLTELYGSPVDVLRAHGRVVIVGGAVSHTRESHHPHPEDATDPVGAHDGTPGFGGKAR